MKTTTTNATGTRSRPRSPRLKSASDKRFEVPARWVGARVHGSSSEMDTLYRPPPKPKSKSLKRPAAASPRQGGKQMKIHDFTTGK